MKSFAVYILLFALVGGALSAKLKRDASSESLPSVQSSESEPSESSEASESDGDELDIALAVLKAKPNPNLAAISKLEAIQAQNKAGKETGEASKPADAGPAAA